MHSADFSVSFFHLHHDRGAKLHDGILFSLLSSTFRFLSQEGGVIRKHVNQFLSCDDATETAPSAGTVANCGQKAKVKI